MIGRVLALVGGLTTAGVSAQFPEFSQQYLQRLGGAVQALDEVVAEFDGSAAKLSLTRFQALEQMQGTAFVQARRADMEALFLRHARLTADYQQMRAAGPFMRLYHTRRMGDRELLRGTWGDFVPALPLSFAGAVFAGAGLVLGWAMVRLVLGALAQVFRRKPQSAKAAD
ncbi:MAG TPA: DUF2937 domain-containing protein [Rhodobacteraceae bacterium]|jgi:hypothetical protein|nr:DUF2937 domain-containing protein [Paracoccaceae bacterium]HBV55674.1 DUF2937 domain-containing protein [Paracoccaceae bacterium]